MAKIIEFNENSRSKILKGAQILCEAVKSTYGPRGNNVIIEVKDSVPKITKDGVTVAKSITLADRFENLGASLLKEASIKSCDLAGDGTTTAVILAERILISGSKYANQKLNFNEIKAGIDEAVALVISDLKKNAKIIKNSEEIAQVATVSANGDVEIGKLIAQCIDKVGMNGVITVEDGSSLTTELEVVEGMRFDRGYISPHFSTNLDKMIAEFDNPLILIHDERISSLLSLVPILEEVAKNGRSLVIIADEVDGDALNTLVINKLRVGLKIAAVRAPDFGPRRKEILEDIAILTGGTVISKDLGLSLDKTTMNMLGQAKKIIITKDDTTIIDGMGKAENIEARRAHLKSLISYTESEYDKDKLVNRLASISGGVAIIRVGGVTEIEMKEKKDRVEDAVHATKAAMEEGIVPGGGIALVRAGAALVNRSKDLSFEKEQGYKIIEKTLNAPLSQLLKNLSSDLERIQVWYEITENEENNYSKGYNVCTQKIGDMFEFGIIDPVKVVRIALQNAASVANLLLTSEVSIVDCDTDMVKTKEVPTNSYY